MFLNESLCRLVFFSKQKPAYEMRISDCSSDVCSSDLPCLEEILQAEGERMAAGPAANPAEERFVSGQPADNLEEECARDRDVHGAVLSGGRDAGRHRQRVPPRSPSPLFRSEEHTSELQSLMRISYAVFCLKKKSTRVR